MKRRVERVVAGTCAASLALGLSACAAAASEREALSAMPEASTATAQPAERVESEGELLGPSIPEDLLRAKAPSDEFRPVIEAGGGSSTTGEPKVNSSGESEVNMYDPSEQEPQDLYGPPPVEDELVEFEPADQIVQLLYGPPPGFDSDSEADSGSGSSFSPDATAPIPFSPSDEPVSVLYGPPPMFEDMPRGSDDPTEEFEPINEMQPVLYGPPPLMDEVGEVDVQSAEKSDSDPAKTVKFKPIVDMLFGRGDKD